MDKWESIAKLLLCGEEANCCPHFAGPYKIGACYLFRLVTNYRTGRVVAVFPQEIVLEDSAWVCDTGRYADCLRNGTFNEVEPSPGNVIIGRGSIVDVDEWNHPLPRVQQ